MKECKCCSIFKESYQFNKDKSQNDLLCIYCKYCLKYSKQKEISIKELKDSYELTKSKYKKCYSCKESKPFSDYQKDSSKKDGVQSRCRICNNLAKANKLNSNDVHARFMMNKFHSKTRGLSFTISEDEYKLLTSQSCEYCGGPNLKLGLDRVNTKIGYQLDNVVSCCETCNRMKLDHDLDLFKEHIEKMYKHIHQKIK